MSVFLEKSEYNISNSLLWGNFSAHSKKMFDRSRGDRIIHFFIAALEILPVIGQITSLFETALAFLFLDNGVSNRSSSLTEKKVKLSIKDNLVMPDKALLLKEEPDVFVDRMRMKLHKDVTDEEIRGFLEELIQYLKPASSFNRSYPEFQGHDTFSIGIFDMFSGLDRPIEIKIMRFLYQKIEQLRESSVIMSSHGCGLSYKDSEIFGVVPLEGLNDEEDTLYRGKTPEGKFVVSQNGVRGCVAGCASMIVSDALGRYVRPDAMNLGDSDNIRKIVQKNGLQHATTAVENFNQLKKALIQNGSACIGVKTVGGHEVVIDKVLDGDRVQIRDPYHGWCVVVEKEAFIKSIRSFPLNLLQVSEQELN